MLDALGITLSGLIFTIVNFFILIFILTKFLFKPFLGALEKRKQTIKESFDNAEAVNKEADERYEKYMEKISHAEEEGRGIVKAAKDRADDQAKLIVDEAKEEAAKIHAQAQRDVEREKEQALSEMREQISSLAILAAEQILEKEITPEGQDQIIDSVLEKAGASEWQN